MIRLRCRFLAGSFGSGVRSARARDAHHHGHSIRWVDLLVSAGQSLDASLGLFESSLPDQIPWALGRKGDKYEQWDRPHLDCQCAQPLPAAPYPLDRKWNAVGPLIISSLDRDKNARR